MMVWLSYAMAWHGMAWHDVMMWLSAIGNSNLIHETQEVESTSFPFFLSLSLSFLSPSYLYPKDPLIKK
jgi:hypothetical protein